MSKQFTIYYFSGFLTDLALNNNDTEISYVKSFKSGEVIKTQNFQRSTLFPLSFNRKLS